MRVRHASEGFKHGEGKTHKQAVQNVIDFITEQKVDVYRGWLVKYNEHFIRREKITWTPEHEYDIAIPDKKIYIEVDGESHGKKDIRGHEQRKEKDGIAEKHANERGIKVIRLDKTECLGEKKLRDEWLMQMLWRYIK